MSCKTVYYLKFNDKDFYDECRKSLTVGDKNTYNEPCVEFSSTESYKCNTDNMDIILQFGCSEEEMNDLFMELVNFVGKKAVVLGYSLYCGEDKVLFGLYYLGGEIGSFTKKGQYALNFAKKSFDDVDKWFGTLKRSLTPKESAYLKEFK